MTAETGWGKGMAMFSQPLYQLNISINKKLREQKDKNTVGQSLHYTQTRRLPVRSHWSEEEIYLQIVLINKSRHWQISGSFLSSLLINTGGRSEANVEENHIPFIKKKTPGKEGIFWLNQACLCWGGRELEQDSAIYVFLKSLKVYDKSVKKQHIGYLDSSGS